MARDPYRYFRIEARELVDALNEGVLDLEKGAPVKEVTARLLRHAHTLKGAARIVKLASVAELAHGIEDALGPFREGHRAIPHDVATGLLRAIESIAERVRSIDAPSRPVDTGSRAVRDDLGDSVRVDIAEVDLLLEGLSETLVQVNGLQRASAAVADAEGLVEKLLEQTKHRTDDVLSAAELVSMRRRVGEVAEDLAACLGGVRRRMADAIGQVGTELLQASHGASRLRLVPASSIFGPLELCARDAAEAVGRAVTFEAHGGEHRLDAHVLSALRDALVHTVRNAVAHGIEPESTRTGAGKPPAGRIVISVERRGSRVAFSCEDDGRGFDVEALRRAAVARGLLGAADAASLSSDALFRLALKGGLTTSRSVNEVSGRAVGLDVVRDTASRLRGEVHLATHPGRGARVELVVPVMLSSVSAILVEAGGAQASIPLDSVRRTLRVADASITRSADGDSLLFDDQAIPFLPLASVLPRGTGMVSPEHWAVLVVDAGGALAGLGVERLLGTANVAMRPLPAWAEVDATVAGVSLDSEGRPQLVLDPHGVVAAARAARGTTVMPRTTAPRPILVIDDSLTTRMLEQSILESAGYEVELATSGEEALVKAGERSYALFVVDVEMPGMSGFEFVARTRADPVLRATPAILVTSRNSEDDMKRGREAGAHAYIVKGEFDQNHLLQAIRELVA